MQFVDEATIEVAAGDGGRGIVSFRRESMMPRGGPDGGDGGNGADVVLEACPRTTTLLDHRYKRIYKANNGAPGGPQNCTGKSAADLVIRVPIGTVIKDLDSGEILADLTAERSRYVAATGGRGGRGNARFATSRQRAPRHAQPGTPGTSRRLGLSLKLMADVGLVGLPNAGKSTFIRATTRSQAKVAAYPFTTLVPNLGVCEIDERSFVIADIPGLIEGAHEGLGIGDRFLKHIERTRVLVHLVSVSPDIEDPMASYRLINHELASYSERLANLDQIVVLNKIDLITDESARSDLQRSFEDEGVKVLMTSALTKEGVNEVLRAIIPSLDALVLEENEPESWSPV